MWQSLVFPNMTAGAICWHPRAVNANVVSCLGRGRLCQYFPSRFPGAGGGTDGLALDFDSPVGGGPEVWWGDCPSGGPSRKMFVGLACPQAPHRTVPYPTTSPVYPSWRAPCLASPLQVFRTRLLTCSSKLSLGPKIPDGFLSVPCRMRDAPCLYLSPDSPGPSVSLAPRTELGSERVSAHSIPGDRHRW